MEAAQLSARLTERFADVVCAVDQFGVVTADVPSGVWVDAARFARDEVGCTYFDWLSAVDEGDGAMVVVVHLWSIAGRHHLLLRTRVPAAGGTAVAGTTVDPSTADPSVAETGVADAAAAEVERASLPTLTGVFRGAGWHERETAEMFGITFAGHPNLVPLLLPDGFEGYPLRKDFVLASRVAKAWPGAKEPGESEHEAAPSRRRVRPPGKPDPDEWREAARSTKSPGEDA